MITGTLRLFGEDDLDRLHAAAVRVLERTGLRVCHDTFLDALAEMGAQVNRSTGIARFRREMVEALIAERRSRPWRPERERGEPEREYKLGLSGVIAPHFYDYEWRVRRAATRADLLDTIRWAEVDLSHDRSVDLAVTMTDSDPRVEPVEAYALLLEHTSRPGDAYCTEAAQIPFLVDLATAYYGHPVFPRGPDFMTSPLTFGDRLANHTLAAIRFGIREFSIGVMPISGGNAPITAAGNVVLSAAEALGAMLTIRGLAPDATFSIAPCNGLIDMRKGTASFNAPEALLSDLGVVELFNRRYGGHAVVAAGADYIDAALPGIQAAHERTYRAMAIAAFTGEHFRMGGQGTLDAGQVFSPEQFILERDMGDGLWQLGLGIEVSEETLSVETIEAVGIGLGRSYLDTEQTLRHWRETWFPRYLYRGEYTDDAVEHARDREMLDAAHRHYRECVARYQPPAIEASKLKEIGVIVQRARETLLPG
jgi:trimethylamine--corrinoid protein Co-methyltransferase